MRTPLASFFEHLFKLHKRKREQGFYYKQVLTLLHQTQTKLLLGNTVEKLINHLVTTNTVYVSAETLDTFLKDTININLLFGNWQDDVSQTLNNNLKIIDLLRQEFKKTQAFVDIEYAYGFFKIFNQLKTLNERYNHIETFDELYILYRDALNTETVDITGSPYEGLQIMGVLESRLLDFDNIILASLNEGIFPSGKTQQSYFLS